MDITKDAETEVASDFVVVKSEVSDEISPEMINENREVNVEPEFENSKFLGFQAESRDVETEITEAVSRSREMKIDEIQVENKEIEKIDEVEPPTFSHRHTNVD